MNNLFDFVFNHGTAVALGCTPFLCSLLLAALTTSWRRWLAITLALITGSVLAFELYSGSLEGNLTGLIWMITTPIAAIAMISLALLEWWPRRVDYPRRKDETPGS